MLTLDLFSLTFAGLLVGNELAIAAFVHPVLLRREDHVHFAVATALAKLLGRVMPVWYALLILLAGTLALGSHRVMGTWSPLITSSFALWVLSIVYTVTALVPINNRIAAWSDESQPSDWKLLRSRWDQLHRWRVLLLTIAFVLLAAGILS